ncbi:hypothetical protein W02_39810 [Nitrospira sp. KM1]|uniref:hypothetical protein n=1 Tax=Nitrospira sp. KM1 TaxID=1936990 RepID=UPI0013A73D03|nr:hypothetical protein [Nitrospira sp. KM1]BCA56841.1 hypothetical protein W02_39810 [Nitrospira sp. KM1]
MGSITDARTYRFCLHGVDLHYETSIPSLAAPVLSFLRHFHTPPVSGGASLTIRFQEAKSREQIPIRASDSAKLLFSGTRPSMGDSLRSIWRCDVKQDGYLLIADFHEQGLLAIDGPAGTVEGYFVKPDAMHADVCTSFFHYALTELLKRRDLFTVHATALEYGGRGVLIPGYSGQGKTTSFLSLLRAGYRYLSDDYPLLRDRGTHMELLAFPMKIDVTDRTVTMFPELHNAPPGVLHQGICKKYFQVEDLYANSIGQSCTPAMILFPHVVDVPHSCLEPLPRSRALEAIMPQALLVYDKDVAVREFKALSHLVEQADCYRLHFGRDVLDLPKLITPLLEMRRSA